MSGSTSRRTLVIGAAALPALAVPALATAATAGDPDPIFALIDAHRVAFAAFSEASALADKIPSDKLPQARVIVDYEDDGKWVGGADAEGPFVRWKVKGKKPIYAYDTYTIERSVPKDLDEQARRAWIEEHTQELAKEEERVKNEFAETPEGKLTAASDEAAAQDWDVLEELVETMPTTPGGLAALLAYVRIGYVRDQVLGVGRELSSLGNRYTWTMERLACAAVGLPEPPEHDTGMQEDDEEDDEA